MKNKILIWCLGMIALAPFACKKPTEGVRLNVNANFFEYSVAVKFVEMANTSATPSNVYISVGGRDASYIYDISGDKDLLVNDGYIQLGINPAIMPTDGNPVEFVIEASAEGYLPVSQIVKINKGETNQRFTIEMMNLTSPPAGIKVETESITLNNGVLGTAGIITNNKRTDSVYYDDGITSVVLPEGTDFYYYKDVVATGTRQVPIIKDSTVRHQTLSGTLDITYHPIVGYYTEEYKYITQVKEKYTGSKVDVYCLTRPGQNKALSVYDYEYSYTNGTQQVDIMKDGKVREDEILFQTAAKQILVGVYFLGTVPDPNAGTRKICLSPSQQHKWFTSMVLDENAINPITNVKIKEGDSIEAGINYAGISTVVDGQVITPSENRSIRLPILKAPNGQLRVQCQSGDVGYYYHAPNMVSFNYEFNTEEMDADIPDYENLVASVELNLGVASFYRNFIPNTGNRKISGKVCSKEAITKSPAKLGVYYWGKQLKNQTLTEGAVTNVFQRPFLVELGPIVDFSFSFKCPDKRVKPNFNGIVETQTGSQTIIFNCNAREGRWRSRGIEIGKTYSCKGNSCGVEFTYICGITSTTFTDEIDVPGICKCF